MKPFNEDPVRKKRCQETAQAIAHGKSPAEVLELLKEIGAAVPRKSEPTRSLTTESPLQSISIWQPVKEEKGWVFRRPPAGPFGDHYCSRITIPLQRQPGTARVCFLGESAAAGYLYAPHLTPAMVLEHQLNQTSPGRCFEVVDFSRTNERLGSLLATFEQALQLAPEVMVVYAGNNWNLLETSDISSHVPDETSRRQFGKKLKESGVEGVLNQAATGLMNNLNSAFSRLSFLARNHQLSVVLVIPEVNLAHWESHQPPPCLNDKKLEDWYDAYFSATTRLETGDWEKARSAALAMLKLDNGTTPTPFRILAQAWAGEGRPENAAEAARAEVDATSYATLCFLDAPRANSLAINMQRRLGITHGFSVVDLPRVFAEHTGSPYPGKRLFLDYCHLTFEGMRVAMAAVTSQILAATCRTAITGPEILVDNPGPTVSNSVHALASLGAAIHTAHRENPVTPKHKRVCFWLKEALDHDSQVAQAMLQFAEARLARVPAVMTSAQIKILDGGFPLTMQHGWRYDHMDGQLLTAMLESLPSEHAHTLREMMVHQRSISHKPVDLAEPYYLWEPLHRYYPEVMGFDNIATPAHHRSPWPFSSFCLVSDGEKMIRLTLTARLPGSRPDESHPVALCINEQSVAALNFTKDWQKMTVIVAPNQLRRGMNQISLCWPILPATSLGGMRRTLDRLDRGLEGHLHPIFGEVYALVAQIVN